MWWSLIESFNWKSFTGTSDDDWSDRLNHKWSVTMLIVFALVVSTGQYLGEPIHCWCPAKFEKTYVDYTRYYCWISNTYAVSWDADLPRDLETRRETVLTYYQWVPMIFLLQALLFKFPNIIWKLINIRSGVNISKICKLMESVQVTEPDERDEVVLNIARYINRWLLDSRSYHRNFVTRMKRKTSKFLFCFGKREGRFLTGIFVIVKFIYCLNCVVQFFILNAFLSMDFWMYGVDVLKCWFNENCDEVKESPRFPRVTMCDLQVRQLHNVHHYTVQCVLPYNIFNEKIFAFLWFWMCFVTMTTVMSLVSWLFYLLFRHDQELFVRKYLRLRSKFQTENDKSIAKTFANDYLRIDGCFMLRMVEKNTSDVILYDVMKNLWTMYTDLRKKKNKLNIPADDSVHSDKLDVSGIKNPLLGNDTVISYHSD